MNTVCGNSSGLSPRVRGNPPRAARGVHRGGSIPACAGEPIRRPFNAIHHGVYPRVCGGTQRAETAEFLPQGLSPRVRGNRAWRPVFVSGSGSIPACAGEPGGGGVIAGGQGVYPRVCGGTMRAVPKLPNTHGLSPRVRGNQLGLFLEIPVGGSIPACAGEPSAGVDDAGVCAVYPRVCGGTAPFIWVVDRPQGLSPRVRGNLYRQRYQPNPPGSIPACAGEPTHFSGMMRCPWVYPRVCGGTEDVPGMSVKGKGLSPRVRGNRLRRPGRQRQPRSIPACAGEPLRSRRRPAVPGVYPRVCGGTPHEDAGHGGRGGLSPRVRGNPPEITRPSIVARSIPACAGEPSDRL